MLLLKDLVRRVLSKYDFSIAPFVDKKTFFSFRSMYEYINIQSSLHRVGSNGDGGYVLPILKFPISQLISFGVDTNSDFEFEMAENGAKCYLFDASVDGPARYHPNFAFQKKFVDCFSKDNFLEINRAIDIADIDSNNSILKMDIEGCEYASLLSLSTEFLANNSVLIVEFHKFSEFFYKNTFMIIASLFTKLATSHAVVHIHQNNEFRGRMIHGVRVPETVEFTFLRKDLIHLYDADQNQNIILPLEIDFPCNPAKSDVPIDDYFK